LVKNFLTAVNVSGTYYAYLRSPDDAQHLSGDIMAMLCAVDEKLQELRSTYREREGTELEILILSDHGNNHAGPPKRVGIQSFLKRAGYRIAKSIHSPMDVVLPTAGIESWVEVHNAPAETERLVKLLSWLEGIDVVTGRDPDRPERFIVMNSNGEKAVIEWHPAENSFRYASQNGDPLNYLPVVEALSKKNKLDAEGFATADAWMAETLTHRYPLALERIVRGFTRAALNPATILISLDNAYAHAGWFVMQGSKLVRLGGTHGALDDLNSNGILMSSFARTQDTSASRVAALFDGFPGLRDYRAAENGAEWLSPKAQALTTISRTPADQRCAGLPEDRILLRIWTPCFAHLAAETPVEVTLKAAGQLPEAPVRRADLEWIRAKELHFILTPPIVPPDGGSCERIYALPSGSNLEPREAYLISGRLRDGKKTNRIFSFAFQTDSRGTPVAY
jgi:hypothetical protein